MQLTVNKQIQNGDIIDICSALYMYISDTDDNSFRDQEVN